MNEDSGFYVESYLDNFNEGLHDWTVDFADYPVNDSLGYELFFEHTQLPAGLGTERALLVSGNNCNQDLFMFIKKKVRYLKPNTEYAIAFDVKFATNTPSGPGDYGDYPGENVYVKAGATPKEPVKVVIEDTYRMNIDKGDQGSGGADMTVIGNISKSDNNVTGYRLEARNNATSFTARTNAQGELWIVVGIDSGYKGITTLYFKEIALALSLSE